MTKYKGFFAYPASPREIGDVIEAAMEKTVWGGMNVGFSTWRALDIAGHFIAEEVIESLVSSEFVAADITRLNFCQWPTELSQFRPLKLSHFSRIKRADSVSF